MTAAAVEHAVRERGLPYSAPMVRAVLRDVDPKTMTRRVVLPQPPQPSEHGIGISWVFTPARQAFVPWGTLSDMPVKMKSGIRCPYGVVGDLLWIREAWRLHEKLDHLAGSKVHPGRRGRIVYEADSEKWERAGRLRAARFMPRWASRIALKIIDVRVERLKEINASSCIAEGIASRGIDRDGPSLASALVYIEDFKTLWDSLNALRGFGWDVNPWVWAIGFKRVTP